MFLSPEQLIAAAGITPVVVQGTMRPSAHFPDVGAVYHFYHIGTYIDWPSVSPCHIVGNLYREGLDFSVVCSGIPDGSVQVCHNESI